MHHKAAVRSYVNNGYQNTLYSASPLLDIYLKDIIIHMQNIVYIKILLVLLLIISKKWDRFKQPSIGDWLIKL